MIMALAVDTMVSKRNAFTFSCIPYEHTAAVLKALRKTSWLEYLLVTSVESMWSLLFAFARCIVIAWDYGHRVPLSPTSSSSLCLHKRRPLEHDTCAGSIGRRALLALVVQSEHTSVIHWHSLCLILTLAHSLFYVDNSIQKCATLMAKEFSDKRKTHPTFFIVSHWFWLVQSLIWR